jgi:hypothetical protein
MIEQFAKVLAAIVGLKASKNIEETQKVLNEALYDFTGLSNETIEKLTYKDLIKLVSGFKEPHVEKCYILAELLKARADIYLSLDDFDRSSDLYLKSFNIYVETMLTSHSSYLNPNYATIDEIISRLVHPMPYETQWLLFQYYEKTKKYGKAEDVLYLLEQEYKEARVLSEGIAFYRRLSEKEHGELAQGNLPIDEVKEGLTMLLKKSKNLSKI